MKMTKKRTVCNMGILAVLLLCACAGCGSRNEDENPVSIVEEPVIEDKTREPAAPKTDTQTPDASQNNAGKATPQPAGQDIPKDAQSGGDLDTIVPDSADDNWYKTGDVYVDENGRRLEVLFDDEGMLQFAVDGLSLYNTMANNFSLENNWRIYTCDDGTTVIYYPGTPAHLEISDGEYAGIYEADDGK